MAKSTVDLCELSPHHCGIYVPNLESSIAWYHDIFGFTVAKRMTIREIPAQAAFMKRGDFYIELFEVARATHMPEDTNTYGTKHIAFVVQDVREVVDTLKKRGVAIVMEGTVENKPMAFIRDNADTLIELVSPGAP